MKHEFPYTLHDFLDRELAPYKGNAPEHVIREKKLEYKRLYDASYRKAYFALHKQVTLQVTKEELAKLKEKAKALGVRVSVYIKSCIEGKKESGQITTIIPLLLSLRDCIEECLHEESLEGLSQALVIIESIQNKLS